MNASKEDSVRAHQQLKKIADAIGADAATELSAELIAVEKFLEACGKRLPTEAAIAKDVQRKKDYHKKRAANKAKAM